MEESILVASDLSPRSDRALERAKRLASEKGCQLTVLHVIDENLPATMADAVEDAATTELRAEASEGLESGDARPRIEIRFGRAYESILDVAQSIEPALVVLGTHRETGSMFQGTTVERVIRAGSNPCLVVKNRARAPYRNVLVAVDFSLHARRAVEFALRFAPDAEIELLHAYHVPYRGFLHGGRELSKADEAHFLRDVHREFSAFLAEIEPEFPAERLLAKEGPPQSALRRHIADTDVDLLVMGTHGRTGVAHAILGSVAEDLLRDPPCDVLVVKAW